MRQAPDFLYPTPFSIPQFEEEGKYLSAGENCGIIKRKVDIGEGYENYFIRRRRKNITIATRE